jgi:hypothetical protein
MKQKSLKIRRGLAAMTLALACFTSPVFAGEITDCYWEVMDSCDDALRNSNWFESIGVGMICAGMLAGCGFEAL